MAQVVPTIVDSVIFECTTSRLYPLSSEVMFGLERIVELTPVLYQEQIGQV